MEFMVINMINMLEQEFENVCNGNSVQTGAPIEDAPNCDWDEYEHNKEYLEKIDDVIQEAFFKLKGNKGNTEAMIGYVEIQSMFDKRVKELFENELVCPDEVFILKKNFM